MARNNPKPTDKIDWEATGNIVPPQASRKLSGWQFTIKPSAQRFNWFWNLTGLQQFYSNAQVEDWIVIDSDADEGDYATIAAYIADSPAAGDRILVKQDEVIAAKMTFPSGITIKFLKGVAITTVTDLADAIEFGSDISIEGTLVFEASHTGTLVDAIVFNGDSCNYENISIENKSTGTITNAAFINSGKKANRADIVIANTGGGTVTNVFVDNSGNETNAFMVRDLVNDSIFAIPLATTSNDGFLLSTDKDKINEGLTFSEASSENAGLVVLPTSGTIEVASLSFGSLTAGDRIAVYGGFDALKGDTAGPVLIQFVKKSGTATIEFLHDQTALSGREGVILAAADVNKTLAAVVKVTGSGTLDLQLSGRSEVSTSNVTAGNGQLYAYFLRKQ